MIFLDSGLYITMFKSQLVSYLCCGWPQMAIPPAKHPNGLAWGKKRTTGNHSVDVLIPQVQGFPRLSTAFQQTVPIIFPSCHSSETKTPKRRRNSTRHSAGGATTAVLSRGAGGRRLAERHVEKPNNVHIHIYIYIIICTHMYFLYNLSIYLSNLI